MSLHTSNNIPHQEQESPYLLKKDELFYSLNIENIQYGGANPTPVQQIFRSNDKWIDKHHLKLAVQSYAACTGFQTCNPSPTTIQCNCYQKPKVQSRNFSSGDNH
jgi:hypothetical protein